MYEFNTTNEDWLNCVVGFRSKRFRNLAEPYKEYDVLVGKIADENTTMVINAYIVGAYGAVGSENAVHTAINNLYPELLRNQITFKSRQSLERITFQGSEKV